MKHAPSPEVLAMRAEDDRLNAADEAGTEAARALEEALREAESQTDEEPEL